MGDDGSSSSLKKDQERSKVFCLFRRNDKMWAVKRKQTSN